VDVPANEFSDLDRSVTSLDGTTHELVAVLGFGGGGLAMFRRRSAVTRVPIVAVVVDGRQVHSEPAADHADADRIMVGLVEQIGSGAWRGA
jgi:hypothetical protein